MPKWAIHKLGILAVGFSIPFVAAEGTGRLWFPIMARFPSGGLVISMGMGPDEEAVKAGAPLSNPFGTPPGAGKRRSVVCRGTSYEESQRPTAFSSLPYF